VLKLRGLKINKSAKINGSFKGKPNFTRLDRKRSHQILDYSQDKDMDVTIRNHKEVNNSVLVEEEEENHFMKPKLDIKKTIYNADYSEKLSCPKGIIVNTRVSLPELRISNAKASVSKLR
jgi:hypothetical protein